MPGRFFLTADLDEIRNAFGATGAPDHAPRRNVAPGQEVLTVDPERRLRPMRWGIVPVGRVNARGRPVMETLVNARSETVFEKSAHAGTGRALVPAEGWYEWTGAPRRKTAWRIRPKAGGLIAFAAITDVWQAPGGAEVWQVATLTCPPNAEVAEVHHRMGVIVAPEDFGLWLTGAPGEVAALLAPLPDGSLVVERADDVNWSDT